MYGKNNTVNNNYFYFIDYTVSESSVVGQSVWMGGNDNKFTKNTFHEFGASQCISTGTGSTITHNHIYNGGYLQTDGSMIHSMEIYNNRTVIAYNWVHDIPWLGIRLDDGGPPHSGRNATIHHNVVWNTDGIVTKGDDHLVHNNTVFWNEKRPEKWADWGWQILTDITILEVENQNLVARTYDNVVDILSGYRREHTQLISPFTSGNYQASLKNTTVESQLIDPENMNFCPKPESEIRNLGIGAYDSECADNWVPGIDWEFVNPGLPLWYESEFTTEENFGYTEFETIPGTGTTTTMRTESTLDPCLSDPHPTGETGREIFVSVSSGNDSYTGSVNCPVKTIQAGIDMVKSWKQQVVVVREGIYFEAVAFKNKYQFNIRTEGRAIIDGSQDIKELSGGEWSLHSVQNGLRK